jgi:DNA-binding NtrC family response regulator
MGAFAGDETDAGRSTVVLACERGPGPWLVEAGPTAEPGAMWLEERETIVLGAGSLARIRLLDDAVSREHCELSLFDGRMSVRDLGSKNGTYVGGARVERASLDPGATVTIGRSVVTCRPAPEHTVDREPVPDIQGVVGSSVAIRRVLRDLARIAGVRANVMFRGETGAGKDVLARALHDIGPRRPRSFVPLNVAALPRDLADAELFGHERGAYTGALGPRDGAFVEANGGTLFLDEIGELPVELQVKLLRVLEDGQVRPLGGRGTRRVDVRVTSATCAPLELRIAEGAFRQDLYQRLTVFVITVPPLRERRSDIPALAHAFLAQMAAEAGAHELSSAALARLTTYGWPGNVRELRNVLYRAALRCHDRVIDAADVAESMTACRPESRAVLSAQQASLLVRSHAGNVSAAARQAGVARSTFRGWLAAE